MFVPGRWMLIVGPLALLLPLSQLAAQEPADPANAPMAQPVPLQNADDAPPVRLLFDPSFRFPDVPKKPADDLHREQSIYIPYTKLKEVFEKDGRGVFLPYERFQALWKAAREHAIRTPEARPPVGALVTEIESEATVGKDVVRVSASLKIEVLADGWVEVPLGLADAAILTARLGEEPARITHDPQAGYKLLLHKKEKAARQYALALEYARAFTKSPGQNSVSFQAPQAPVNRWKIRIPESGVKVDIQPLIAATEAPAEMAMQPEKPPANNQPANAAKANETVIMAFVGASPTVRIDWTPKAEGATGLEALATVQSQQQVIVDEGVLRTRTRLAYEISRAELSQLVMEVPADHKVVNVFDANVRQWVVEALEGGAQKVTVQLFQAIRGSQSVLVELEKFTGEAALKELAVPMVKAVGVGRQQGIVVVQLAPGLRGEASKRTGLLQLDAGELPQDLANQSWQFAFRYAALPFELSLSVEKIKPRILADELVETYLEPQQQTLNLFVIYMIERAGVFQLELEVPTGFDVRQVRGQPAQGVEPAVIDTHHLEGETKNRLIVNLAQKAIGKVGLLVELQKRLDDPNLLTPTGASSELPLSIARVAPSSVERATGRLIVYAPESLRLNPSKSDGLRGISFSEALEGTQSARADRFPTLRPVLSYAFTSGPADLAASVERRKPHLNVGQLLSINIEPGVVKYQATFSYEIRYSGVKSLRIDLPVSVAAEVRNLTTGIREQQVTPPPEGLPPNYVAWSFAGETELLGNVSVQLAWEQKLENLEIGKSVSLPVPALQPRDVDRAWGQIVISKAETIEVRPATAPVGLRSIDPQHDLMPGASVPNAAGAFEFHEDWTLSLSATRYELEQVKHTAIERAVARMVATRSDQIAVQALYRMRSAMQRLKLVIPGDFELDSQPLRINGQPVAIEKGDQTSMFVPLTGRSPDEPFLLELRYTVKDAGAKFQLPEFPDDPAVQKVYLCTYLPEDRVLLGAKGEWAEEFTWQTVGPTEQHARVHRTDSELVNWVMEGISIAGNPFADFSADGRLLIYSTLQPAAGDEGALTLIAMDEDWLNGLVLAVVAVLGLALVRRAPMLRIAGLVLLVIAVVLAGAFAPTFSHQVFDGLFLAAIGLVLLVWIAEFVGMIINRFSARPTPAASPFAAPTEKPPEPDAHTSPPREQGTEPPASKEGGPSQ